MKVICTPVSDEVISGLNAGEAVYITGKIYTARDAAHKKIVELMESGEKLPGIKIPGIKIPFNFDGQAVFYAGPTPAKPPRPIGCIGPTTSGRMDKYSPLLISKGLKVMIGKGNRSEAVIEAIVRYRGIYFAAIGGVAALMAKTVKSARVIAFEELGTEAVAELEVENFPAIVAIDSRGRNIYMTTVRKSLFHSQGI